MGRSSKPPPSSTPSTSARSREDLLTLVDESIDFLRTSAAAYDEGTDHEAKRLAVTLRVLLHQTNYSHALLEQLRIRDRLAWHDSAGSLPNNTMPVVSVLTGLRITPGQGGAYIAPLDTNAPAEPRTKDFAGWWHDPVTRLPSRVWCRKDYVITLANREGGAHVDPRLNALYEDIVKQNLYAWSYTDDAIGGTSPFTGNPVTAGVRQITHEVLKTLDEQLPALRTTLR